MIPVEVRILLDELKSQDSDLSTVFTHGQTDIDTILYCEICAALRTAESEIQAATARYLSRHDKSETRLGSLNELL